jgi:hypothetical protein
MFNLKKITTLQKYMITVAAIAVLGIIFLLIATNKQPRNSVLHPNNGTYKITDVRGVTCRLSEPPTCSGKLIISEEGMDRAEVTIDPGTRVRHETREIQIYPNALKEGMMGKFVFKPNSTTIESVVIPD